MHRCSSSHGNMVGPCTCGLFHSPSNSFSMLFSMPSNQKAFDEGEMYSFMSSSSSPSSSVDCTLSLGTPSTRLSSDYERQIHHHDGRSTSCISNFCWDILQPKHVPPPQPPTHKTSRGSNSSSNSGVGDPLLARRCANCDTTSTPLWRNGPRGPKSLCNACGIRFKKEERRATAAAVTTTPGGGAVTDPQHGINNNSWVVQHSQAQKVPCFSPDIGNEFRFIDDNDDNSSDAGIPFLSWRLNVTDRPSLVHDFTR